jgi:hypothetical protein
MSHMNGGADTLFSLIFVAVRPITREFYFSVNNLCRDVYLRMRMSQDGWVPLQIICNFNKMKQLTTDKRLILDTLKAASTKLEVDDAKQRLRIKGDWATWVFPKDEETGGYLTGEGLKFLSKEEAEELQKVPEPLLASAPREDTKAGDKQAQEGSRPTTETTASSAKEDDWQPASRRRKTGSLLRRYITDPIFRVGRVVCCVVCIKLFFLQSKQADHPEGQGGGN